jgi:ubiquinone/menaquinone biosynthesis C-methylase UbiE
MPTSENERYTLEGAGHRGYMQARSAAAQAQFVLAYLKPGLRVLDAGCGAGAITLEIAALAAPGEVIGVDREPKQVQAGTAAARERGLSNAVFRTGDVYALPFADDSFDIVFSDAVLEHLKDPVRALREFRRVLKNGGIVGIRNADGRGNLLSPADALIQETMALTARFRAHNGGNYFFGSETKRLLREGGFAPIEVAASFETDSTPETVQRWARMAASMCREGNLATGLIEQGWIDRDRLELAALAWLAWAENPDAFQARAWVHGLGRKE